MNGTGLRDTAAPGWRVALPALGLVLAWILFWYRDTGAAMVGIWMRSETFTHAFLVPPISLWLIWRQRHALAAHQPRPGLAVLALVLLAGFAWLLGELAAINVVTQFALVGMLVLAVPTVLGGRIALAMLFPLAYLFFAVPFGEFVMPQFMEWTADFTVWALGATGVPVYREGLQFVIPSGRWSVVEACSGVRYLIASMVVGTLYAYLNYRSWRRRVVFVGVSFLVPIVANWVRAYIIVMLGHLSGNELAAGADHLIYGWVFFGAVILLMFWIGAHWAEHPDPDAAVGGERTPVTTAAGGRLRLVAVALALATVWPALWSRALDTTADTGPGPRLTLAAPGDWEAANPLAVDWRPAFAGPNSEQRLEYRQAGRRVGVFVGYYRHQDHERKLVNSENVLVKSKDPVWARVASGARDIDFGDRALRVRTAELRRADEQRLTVWQWYWIAGRWTSSDHLAKTYTALSRLLGQGDDSAVVVLYAPKDQAGGGEAALEAFARAAGPAIGAALDDARARRD